MKFKAGSKVRFVKGTAVTRFGRNVDVDYNKVYQVVSTNWGRSSVMVDGVGVVYVYSYQLKFA